MAHEWHDRQPIYRQLRDRIVAMILDDVLKEGDPLPSVRTVAAEYRINPLTVLKGYQHLAEEGLVETRRVGVRDARTTTHIRPAPNRSRASASPIALVVGFRIAASRPYG